MLPSEVFRRFRHAPIGATKALFDGDRIGVNTTPLQADEFTDSQACPHGDEDHRGVRLGSHSRLRLIMEDTQSSARAASLKTWMSETQLIALATASTGSPSGQECPVDRIEIC
jgi:hypothetical protein